MGNGTSPVILHISDLHFGWDDGEQAVCNRNRIIGEQGLLGQLAELEPEWKPKYICFTGDIGGRGQASDYAKAQAWLKDLLGVLDLQVEALMMCPGNHDSDRAFASRYARPSDGISCDGILQYPIIGCADYLTKPFVSYCEFCEQMGVPQYVIGDWNNYLIGARASYADPPVNFVSLNSAWFAQGEGDDRRLWLGLQLLQYLESEGRLPKYGSLGSSPLTVVLMHHPDDWLHEDERRETPGRGNTRNYLHERCHVVLTGHTHQEPQMPTAHINGAFHFTVGSTYEHYRSLNTFNLIRVEGTYICFRLYEYQSSHSEGRWVLRYDCRIKRDDYVAQDNTLTPNYNIGLPGVNADIPKIIISASKHLQLIRDAIDIPIWKKAYEYADSADEWIKSLDQQVIELLEPQICLDLHLVLADVEIHKGQCGLSNDSKRLEYYVDRAKYYGTKIQ